MVMCNFWLLFVIDNCRVMCSGDMTLKECIELILFFFFLVEVQSQTVPYITFLGTILPNHSYVDLSQVGRDRKGNDSDTVQCHTDLITCCRVEQGIHRGDWFAPGNDTRLTFYSDGEDIFEDRQAQVVHIRRRNNAAGPSGIYRCVVATNAVHNDSDGFIGEIAYVGVYANGGKYIAVNTYSVWPQTVPYTSKVHMQKLYATINMQYELWNSLMCMHYSISVSCWHVL